jgi:hypothetical protein
MEHLGKTRRVSQFSVGCLFLGMTLVALPLGGISYLVHRRNAWLADVERRQRQDLHTLKQVVIDVESVCRKLGRSPKNQSELESLMGKPLPNVHDNGHPTPIHYQSTGQTSYMLQYELWATDDWIYDSTTPTAGWVQHWY